MWFLIGRRRFGRQRIFVEFSIFFVVIFFGQTFSLEKKFDKNAFTVRYDADVNIGKTRFSFSFLIFFNLIFFIAFSAFVVSQLEFTIRKSLITITNVDKVKL